MFLLLFMEPLQSYKTFSTIILTSDFLFRCFSFDKIFFQNINKTASCLINRYYPNMHRLFKDLKIDVWEVFMIEVIIIIYI